MLMGRCHCRYRDENDQEGQQGEVKGKACDPGQRFTIAVEKKANCVDDLVGNEHVPGLYLAEFMLAA